jgi:molecular chaperone GrpE
MHVMVNKKHENKNQEDLEITNEDTEITEPDLADVEAREVDIIKSLRDKLKVCDQEKREILEETQRVKADFLNARKRLEEERLKDRERSIIGHIERLLPLCDSFQMAMADKESWDKADANWRKGVEGIYSQLQSILNSYNVKILNPVGQAFDPYKHEALSNVATDDEKQHDKIMTVIQMGYEMQRNDGTFEQIRPARVAIGVYEKN